MSLLRVLRHRIIRGHWPDWTVYHPDQVNLCARCTR